MTDRRNLNYVIYEVRECPLCGKTDKLEITDYELFNDLMKENGSATISIDCARCNLTLYEHSYHGLDYNEKMGILVRKWNTRSEFSG